MSSIRGIESTGGKFASEALSDVDRPRISETQETQATEKVDFSSVLGGVIDSTATRLDTANQKADAFSRGVLDDVHGTMVAAKEAEISLKLVGSIRNKVLDAFQELWRTNV